MTDIEITIKVQAIAALFNEYLAYYKPIYLKQIEKNAEGKPRHQRREYIQNAIKDIQFADRLTRRFSETLEKLNSGDLSDCIDVLHESLETIKIIENN